jgi:hypothetical protein
MLDVTNIERTLVDIAVRPAYAGGVYQVLAAYEGARGHASAEKIEAILKNPQYKYPYHQSIGFYMERAGFSEQELSPLKELGLEHDFYLDYGMAKTNIDYNDSWRLFHPKGF